MSCVSVPVLSVHSTSIAPKFCIASSRLTITFLRDSTTAPFASVDVTIIGSISGVRPIATEIANRKASSQSCLRKPFSSSTIGVITIMKRTSSQLTWLMPAWNAVGRRSTAVTRSASAPKYVLLPVATMIAVAEPLMTFVPMKPMFSSSSGLRFGQRARVASLKRSRTSRPAATRR